MKGIDIFCASQASTAISQITMDKKQPSISSPSSSSSSSSTILFAASPAIDRHNPIITDSRRILTPSTNSPPPVAAKPHKNHRKQKTKTKTKNQKIIIENGDRGSTKKPDDDEKSIKISTNNNNAFISPPGSTRYLLSERVLFNSLSDLDRPVLKLFPAENSEPEAVKTNGSCDEKPLDGSPVQVVVLRVSLHCRGCERKMRKHISRMEGVTSFNIDFAAKKVTVTGNITPLEVLSSISKVKNAQLWPPTISSSTPPPLNLTNSEFKNEYNGVGA